MPATPAPPTGFTPVTLKQHGNRFWRRPRGYGFAAGWAHFPLCMAEVAHMAALLPLAFAPIKPGGSRLGPVALCGPETAPPLCPETGAWRLPYVPAILRAYPFHVRQTEQQQLELWVYDSPETLSGVPTDQPFFGPDGQPAQQLEEVIGFLQQFDAAMHEAHMACGELKTAGLLCPMQPSGWLHPDAAKGLWAVNPAALDGLADAAAGLLLRSGALAMAHAQQISQHHLQHAKTTAKQSTQTHAGPAQPNDSVTSFLQAMAQARQGDMGANI